MRFLYLSIISIPFSLQGIIDTLTSNFSFIPKYKLKRIENLEAMHRFYNPNPSEMGDYRYEAVKFTPAGHKGAYVFRDD